MIKTILNFSISKIEIAGFTNVSPKIFFKFIIII